jgi:hypothetical protein
MEGGRYEVELTELATGSTWPEIQIIRGDSNPAITINRACGAAYYWRVRTVSGTDVIGPWSETSAFRLMALSPQDDPFAPPAPALEEPGGLDPVAAPTLASCELPFFHWTPVSDPNGLAGYDFYLQQYNGELPKWATISHNFTQEPAATEFQLEAGASYRWRVQAVDNAGNLSASPWGYFNCPHDNPVLDLPILESEQVEILTADPSLMWRPTTEEPVLSPGQLEPSVVTQLDIAGLSSAVLLLPGQDLAVQSFNGPQVAQPGQPLGPLELVIANQGYFGAGQFLVDLVLSPDPVIDSTDQPLINGRAQVEALAAGDTLVVPLAAALPADVPAGHYYLGVILDPFGYQAETDETNNTTFWPIEVTD